MSPLEKQVQAVGSHDEIRNLHTENKLNQRTKNASPAGKQSLRRKKSDINERYSKESDRVVGIKSQIVLLPTIHLS